MDISTTTSSVKTSNNSQSTALASKVAVKSDIKSSFEVEMKKNSTSGEVERSKADDHSVECNGEQETTKPKTDEKNKVNDNSKKTDENDKVKQMNEDASNAVLDAELKSMKNQIDVNNLALKNANRDLQNMALLANYSLKVDYNTIQMDMDDAQFFTDLVNNPDMTLQNVVTQLQNNTNAVVQQGLQKNIHVSSVLFNALSDAVKLNQPFRIDFDKDISVVIKVDKDGVLSANFIPGDSAVEQYLKQNMQSLRQKFNEKEIPYNELSYSNQQQKRQQRDNNKGDK